MKAMTCLLPLLLLLATSCAKDQPRRVQNDNLEGVWYQTKGDANNAPDPDLASASAIVGLSLGELPWWQDLAVQGQTPKGRLVVFGGLFLLVALGEGSDLVRAVRRKSEES